MRGISVNWAFWLGVIITIDQGIAHGAMNFDGLPPSWTPIIEAWAGNFTWIGTIFTTALAGLSGPGQGVLAKFIFRRSTPHATMIFFAICIAASLLAATPTMAQQTIAAGQDAAAKVQRPAVHHKVVRKLPPKGGGVSPFPFPLSPIPGTATTTPTTTPTTTAAGTVDPITWLRSFSVTDLQNALNQANRIDAVCLGGTVTSANTLALTGCTSTPHVGDTLTSTGGDGSLTTPVTITAVGAFASGAGNVTLSSAQTLIGVGAVTATNTSLPVDIITAPCWAFLLGVVQGTVPAILPTTPGVATFIQTAFDDEARLASWFNPGGMFDQFGLACAPLINKINVQVAAGGTTIAAAVAGGPGASAAIIPGLQAILGGVVALAIPKL